jgi:hypothetical protein
VGSRKFGHYFAHRRDQLAPQFDIAIGQARSSAGFSVAAKQKCGSWVKEGPVAVSDAAIRGQVATLVETTAPHRREYPDLRAICPKGATPS